MTMDKNPYLTPWIIPRWAIEDFCEYIRVDEEVVSRLYFVSQIIEHSPTQYLVITSGNYPEMELCLKSYLARLFEVVEDSNEQTTEV